MQVILSRLGFLVLVGALIVGGLLGCSVNRHNLTSKPEVLSGVQKAPGLASPASGYQPDSAVSRATASDQLSLYLTINVDITDAGVQPSSLYLPVGKSVLLVMRNRGVREHHYHVSGLVPADMLWLSKEGDVGDADSEEHSDHNHGGGMVPYHICSPGSGVCPTGNDVHTHAMAGDMDAILFTTTVAGTFTAQDPLHPEIVGNVIVY